MALHGRITSYECCVEAGVAGEKLAREDRGGLGGLLAQLEAEAEGRLAGYAGSVTARLMEAWVMPGDDRLLKSATGRTREQWLQIARTCPADC